MGGITIVDVSDVWQGPGWWLASDGKWYPADAEPGAVYEGDLPNTDAPNPTTVDPSTQLPGAKADPVAAPEPVRADEIFAAEPPPADPQPVAPAVEVPAAVADVPEMPAPVVESAKVGGWQAVDSTEPEIPDPFASAPDPVAAAMEVAATAPVVDDGWTSAYEERQTDIVDSGSASVAPVETPAMPPMDVPAVAAPDAGLPTEPPVPNVSIPDVSIPDVSVPDVSMPDMGIPDVSVPDVSVPDVSVPDLSVPDVSVPDVSVPDVSAPDVSIPDVSMPDVSVPDVSVPDVSMPDVSLPDVSVPAVSAPQVPIHDSLIPDAAIPDVSVPDVSVPDVSAPLMGAPGIDVPDVPTTPLNTVPLGNDVTQQRDIGAPIERQDAWRKPLAPDAASTTAPAAAVPPGRPDVVDLAIPEETIHHHPEAPGRYWRLVGGVLVALLALVAIAWLISTLFSGNDTGTTTTDSTSSSAAPAETETTATDPDADAGTTAAPAADSTQAPTTEGETSVFALRAGDCIVGDIGAGQVTKVEKVDCELEHQFEVYREALIDSSITAFDEEAISAYAEEVCRTSLAAYIPADDDRGLKFKFLQPTEDSWNQEEDPDRVITCLLFDDDAPLIGRAA